MISDKKMFSYFPYKSIYNMCPLRRAHFWPKGHNLNKLGRGPLDEATYQISRL